MLFDNHIINSQPNQLAYKHGPLISKGFVCVSFVRGKSGFAIFDFFVTCTKLINVSHSLMKLLNKAHTKGCEVG